MRSEVGPEAVFWFLVKRRVLLLYFTWAHVVLERGRELVPHVLTWPPAFLCSVTCVIHRAILKLFVCGWVVLAHCVSFVQRILCERPRCCEVIFLRRGGASSRRFCGA